MSSSFTPIVCSNFISKDLSDDLLTTSFLLAIIESEHRVNGILCRNNLTEKRSISCGRTPFTSHRLRSAGFVVIALLATFLTQPALAATTATNHATKPSPQEIQNIQRTLANPRFWSDLNKSLRIVGKISLRPYVAKHWTFIVDGMKVLIKASSEPRNTTIHPQCIYDPCVGSFNAQASWSFYDLLGIWAATVTFNVPYSWNLDAHTDFMSTPYWTYNHAWFEVLNSITQYVYAPYHSGTDWSSGGYFNINFLTQWFGITEASCSASTTLNLDPGFANDSISLHC